jgi:hypothetical protein
MKWSQGTAGDDPTKREIIYSARDGFECEYIVALHDDGATWNYTRSTAGGELLDLRTDFKDAAAAMKAADEDAAANDRGP